MIDKYTYPKTPSDDKGFTILELLIATAISSGAILLLMFGFLSMSVTYTKGLTVAETQNTARDVLNTVSQSIEFADPATINPAYINTPSATSASGWFCANNSIFVYTLGVKVTSTTHALVENSILGDSGCPNSGITTATDYINSNTTAQELLGPNMRLTAFNVRAGADNTYTINIKVAYGEDAVLQGSTIYDENPLYYDIGSNQVKCNGQIGQDFCATSALQTVVESRLAN